MSVMQNDLIRFPVEGVVYPSAEDAKRYLDAGAWLNQTIGDTLRASARRLPDKWAMVSEQGRINYRDFDTTTEVLGAALLELGLRPGDRAIFQMGSILETAVALVGCAKAGIVPVCTLPQHRAIEISALIERSDAKAYFIQADFGTFDLVEFGLAMAAPYGIRHVIVARSPNAAPANFRRYEDLIRAQSFEDASRRLATVPIGISDVLMFQLSGGTTSTPKIIPRLHGEFLGMSHAWANRTGMDSDVVTLYALPLIHNAGLVAMLYPTILLGGTFVLLQRMEAKSFFTWVEREQVTHSLSIGPGASKLLDYSDIRSHDLSSLRLLMNFHGSEAMERHVGVCCLDIFGITEGLITSSEILSPANIRFGTVGWPVSAQDEIRLLDPSTDSDVGLGEIGELCFRGPSSIRGYYRMADVNQASFTSDGFFRTGDMMIARDVEGRVCYQFQGRIKDNIDRGGEKFGAEEVENIIGRHPDVLEAKIVAMPDRVYGEKACAFVAVKPGSEPLTVKSLSEFLIEQGLAKFKLPERVEIIDNFPVTRVGKIDKSALRERIKSLLALEEKAAGQW